MPRPVSSGLNTVRRRRADGSVTHDWYHRRTGTLIGRERDGMTREQAIERGRTLDQEAARAGPPQGSFGELCALYLASPAFTARAKRTKSEYQDHITILRAAWEEVPLPGITRKAITLLHAGYADRPWRGNAILRTLRLVLAYGGRALEIPCLARNPAQGVEMHPTRPRDTLWPQAHIEAFLAAATALGLPRMRKAIALLLYTAQRPSDVLTMATPMLWEADGRTWIRLRQGKTGIAVDVPCHARLAAELRIPDPLPRDRRQRMPSTLLLPSPTGRPWRYRNFARLWDRVVARANLRLAREALAARGGLPPVTAPVARTKAKAAVREMLLTRLQRRDLRRTGVVQMAIAGATIAQIAAVTGWKIERTQEIVDTYLPRRGEVALGGIERWEAAPSDRIVPLAPRRR